MSKFIEVHYPWKTEEVLINTEFIRDITRDVDGARICYQAGDKTIIIHVKESYDNLKRQLMGVTNDEDSHGEIANE